MHAICMQVMADAADACVRAVLDHCPSNKLAALICDTAVKDKSSKTRLQCSIYLLQVYGGGGAVGGTRLQCST